VLSAEIIEAPDRQGLTVRAAYGRTEVAEADFSCIRDAELGGFALDRLMSIVNRGWRIRQGFAFLRFWPAESLFLQICQNHRASPTASNGS
jgi:hypothetical protein